MKLTDEQLRHKRCKLHLKRLIEYKGLEETRRIIAKHNDPYQLTVLKELINTNSK